MAIIDKPTDYFNTVLYTGNASTNAITVGLQPDFTWLKLRVAGSGQDHTLYDSVRGATKFIESNTSNAEATGSNYLTSFDSNGFTLGNDQSHVNGSGDTYVSWNWKAGTSVSGNTTGSGTAKTYTGSVNTDAGFSIIKYTGNGTSGHTIPHNLTQKPAMIIVKNLTGDNWTVYHHKIASDPATDYIFLNSTAAASDYAGYWNDTEPTSSVFTVGNDGGSNANDVSLIAYCFAEKKGYSKFGSYTGNGNADGTFVYTGQKSAFVMIKNTSGTGDWLMYDSKRNPANVTNLGIKAHSSDAEASYDNLDILSNGFKLRRVTGSLSTAGSTYIYMAFAEESFVSSSGVPATAR